MYLLSALSLAGFSWPLMHEKICFAQLGQGPCSCVCHATVSHTFQNCLENEEFTIKLVIIENRALREIAKKLVTLAFERNRQKISDLVAIF